VVTAISWRIISGRGQQCQHGDGTNHRQRTPR
jgi:hypothetical protein